MSKKDDELDRSFDGFAKYDLTGKLGEDSRPASCSPNEVCNTCHHWEWDGGRHGFASGYCPLFDKVTHKDHGSKCTAWEKIHLENAKSAGTDASEKNL